MINLKRNSSAYEQQNRKQVNKRDIRHALRIRILPKRTIHKFPTAELANFTTTANGAMNTPRKLHRFQKSRNQRHAHAKRRHKRRSRAFQASRLSRKTLMITCHVMAHANVTPPH